MTDDPKKPSSDEDEAPRKLDDGPTGDTVTKIESPKKKAEAESKKASSDDEPEPTGAQTPLAKKDEKATTTTTSKPPAKKAADEDDDDDDEDDEDEDEAPPVRRPGAKAPTNPFAASPSKGGAGRPPAKRPAAVAKPGPSDGRRVRASGESAGLLLLTGALLVVLNIGLQGVSRVRYDATKQKKLTLSEKGTVHLLSTLKKPLKIEVYAPEGLATIDAFIRDLRDLLDEYVRYGGKDPQTGNDRVSYEIIYPDRLEGDQKNKAEAAAQEAGLKKEIIGEAKGGDDKGATIGEGFFGMNITYGGEHKALSQEQGFDERSSIGIEFLISKTIRELRDKEDKLTHRIGFLSGHKEIGDQILQRIFGKEGPVPYYSFEEVKLEKGDKPIDTGLDGLIISQPEEEITTKELRRIDEFLMKGKTVAVFANTVHVKEADPSMNATFNGFGIDKLLAGYGIDFKPGLLIDGNESWTPELQGKGGRTITLKPISTIMVADAGRSDATFDDAFPPLFRIQQLALPYPQEITVDQARAGGDAVKVRPVIKATSSIYTLTGTTISVHPEHTGAGGEAKAETRSKGQEPIVAVDLEGPLKSAFPGGGDGITPPANAPNTARLFVVSSGYFFGNPYESAGKSPFAGQMQGMPANFGADERLMLFSQMYNPLMSNCYMVAWHTLDWTAEELDLLSLPSKLLPDPELTYSNIPAPQPKAGESPDDYEKDKQKWRDRIKTEQRTTFWLATLGGPLLLILFGIGRWYWRNATRAAVKL